METRFVGERRVPGAPVEVVGKEAREVDGALHPPASLKRWRLPVLRRLFAYLHGAKKCTLCCTTLSMLHSFVYSLKTWLAMSSDASSLGCAERVVQAPRGDRTVIVQDVDVPAGEVCIAAVLSACGVSVSSCCLPGSLSLNFAIVVRDLHGAYSSVTLLQVKYLGRHLHEAHFAVLTGAGPRDGA